MTVHSRADIEAQLDSAASNMVAIQQRNEVERVIQSATETEPPPRVQGDLITPQASQGALKR